MLTQKGEQIMSKYRMVMIRDPNGNEFYKIQKLWRTNKDGTIGVYWDDRLRIYTKDQAIKLLEELNGE